ncbi:LysR family transcriptional regulator [Methylophaga thalassica]|uniref:LysR family transcriptional regulator n=1 Tax=Methylophaga aminisulfidivorans TaxID=230105 RepID=UPI003A94AB8B
MQSLDDMVIFGAVIDAGGFTAAAKQLGISTPVVSKRITALEKELGARLLFRSTRRLSLTEEGRIFYHHCRKVISVAHEAEAAVTYLNDTPRGLLRITAPVTFGSHQVAEAIPGFLDEYPEVSVEMDVSDRTVDLADEGYDIAIRLTREPPPLYVAKLLSTTHRVVCASPVYWQKFGKPKVPADLAVHQAIVYTPNPTYNHWIFEKNTEIETVEVKGRFNVNNTDAMLEAAIGGMGVIMLTSYTVDKAIASGQLEAVLEEYETPGANIYAMYLPTMYLSSKARAFIDYMKAWCQKK